MTPRRRLAVAAGAASAAAALAGLSADGPAAVRAAQSNSSMVGAASTSCYYPPCYAFSPANITIHQGDTVSWSNTTSADHTPAADDGAFNAGTVSSGSQKATAPITAPGTHTYHCQIHTYMAGTVTVIANTPPATAPATVAATPRPTPVRLQPSTSTASSSSTAMPPTPTPTQAASSPSAVAAAPSVDSPASTTSTSSARALDAVTVGSSGSHTGLLVTLVVLGLLGAGGVAAWLLIRPRGSPVG
ncbi:MAG TPA: plastocyanin/azurin family copper-binding protein [Candidatus Dormibacteraeota bacterium]|nr:plastocyanin/azurin family copper-binding protein [Candidatus Dormibacteraeota bacterium]